MANCNSCNGGNNGCTRVGALGSVCRSGCRYPYYMGPCPSAPCSDGCGNQCSNNCGCGDTQACGFCRNCCGCANGQGCGECGNNGCCDDGRDPCTCPPEGNRPCWKCRKCGCRNCGSNLNCKQCGCDHDHGGRPDCPGQDVGHGMFEADCPVSLAAGGSIDFEARSADARYFGESRGNVLIRRPGLYYAAITVNIPKDVCTDTVLNLEMEGRSDALLSLPVATQDDCTASNFAASAVFHAKAGALLKLTTLNDLCVPCGCGHPLITLTLIKIR